MPQTPCNPSSNHQGSARNCSTQYSHMRITQILSLSHWSQTQFLEGHSSAQYSYNPNQTHLIQIIKVYRITRNFQAGVLELVGAKSAELRPSRNWVWDHCFKCKASCSKPQLCQKTVRSNSHEAPQKSVIRFLKKNLTPFFFFKFRFIWNFDRFIRISDRFKWSKCTGQNKMRVLMKFTIFEYF